jgi:hypothetical protein
VQYAYFNDTVTCQDIAGVAGIGNCEYIGGMVGMGKQKYSEKSWSHFNYIHHQSRGSVLCVRERTCLFCEVNVVLFVNWHEGFKQPI